MAAPLKVLAVVNSLGFGGTERMLERIAVRFTESGWAHMTVCSLGELGPIGLRLQTRGVEVIALGSQGRGFGAVLREFLGVRRLLRARRFDLVHSFLYRSHLAARLARMSLPGGIPLISSERCLGDNRPWITRFVNRVMSRFSDRVLAVSSAVRETIVHRDRVPSSKVAVLRNGVEMPGPNPRAGRRLRTVLGIDPSEVIFLMLGRLHREKGADLFLEALGRLRALGVTGWRAVLVGSGPEEEMLRERARLLGLESQLIFAGARRTPAAWIEAADVLVLPSREEGLPVSALEAMARRRPVIATRVGGTPEVVREGETGLLVSPEDSSQLAEAMGRLLANPALRRQLGERGREVVSAHFSLPCMVNEVLHSYHETIEAFRRKKGFVMDTALARSAGD